jgi:hypothetical protein
MNTALMYHADNAEMHYRHVCYLYQTGFTEEAYLQLEIALEKDPEQYHVIFELLPGLENDPRIQQLIAAKRK